MNALRHRLASQNCIPAIAALMERAIEALQRDFLSPKEVAASRISMGLDTQLIDEGTNLVAEAEERLAGCGGWSRRATLYGGNHSAALRNDRLLDPATELARIRAMYTDPAFVRRGVGRLILSLSETAAREAGFTRAEMIATLAGEPLYLACGYAPIERVQRMSAESAPVPGRTDGQNADVRRSQSIGRERYDCPPAVPRPAVISGGNCGRTRLPLAST